MPYRSPAELTTLPRDVLLARWRLPTVARARLQSRGLAGTMALSMVAMVVGLTVVPWVGLIGVVVMAATLFAWSLLHERGRREWSRVLQRLPGMIRDERFEDVAHQLDGLVLQPVWSPDVRAAVTITRGSVAVQLGDEALALALCDQLDASGWCAADPSGRMAYDVAVVRAAARVRLDDLDAAERAIAHVRTLRAASVTDEASAHDARRRDALWTLEALLAARRGDHVTVMELTSPGARPATLPAATGRLMTVLRAISAEHLGIDDAGAADALLAGPALELENLARRWPAVETWLARKRGT